MDNLRILVEDEVDNAPFSELEKDIEYLLKIIDEGDLGFVIDGNLTEWKNANEQQKKEIVDWINNCNFIFHFDNDFDESIETNAPFFLNKNKWSSVAQVESLNKNNLYILYKY